MIKKLQKKWQSYRDPHLLVVLLQGISSGIPIVLIGSTLAVWLSEAGVSLTTIGLTAAIWMPYSLKFLWAPCIDLLPIPFITKRIGRRRSWLMLSQAGLIVALIGLGSTHPQTHLLCTVVWALMVSIFSATQDAVIDSYRIEILPPDQQADGVACTTVGYRIGMLIAGSGALVLAEFYGWQATYSTMALLVTLGLIAAWFGGEPSSYKQSPFTHLHNCPNWKEKTKEISKIAIINPFRDFMSKNGWLWVLLLIVSFKMPDAFAGVMTNTLMIKIGFTKIELAAIVKLYGTLATVLGVIVGGHLTHRFALIPCLTLGIVLQAISNLMLIWLYHEGHNPYMLIAQVSAENFCGGIASVMIISYMSRICVNPLYTATQYALLAALVGLARNFLSAPSGFVVEHYGWVVYILISVLLAIPSLIILYYGKQAIVRFEAAFTGKESASNPPSSSAKKPASAKKSGAPRKPAAKKSSKSE